VKICFEKVDINKTLEGENVDIKWKPLHYAANGGHSEIVEWLLQHGADVNKEREDDDCTPLYLSASKGNLEIMKLLIKKGADINKTNKYGWTPLNSAAENGHLEVVKLLIENGADIHKSSKYGWTPFYSAANNGHFGVVKLLIDNNAKIDNEVMQTTHTQEIIELFNALKKPWTFSTHHYFPQNIQRQIATTMMLAFKLNNQFRRVPRDLFPIICEYVAAQPWNTNN